VIYHCISRVVERRMHFGPDEKEQLRTFMRMYEKFSGNRVLAYCFMSNHIHVLLEVTPMPVGGLSDAELLSRLRAIQNEAEVFEVARELREARAAVAAGRGEEAVLVGQIHDRFTYRMHDLSQFMKGFLRRYSQWHNRRHKRKGHLWEERFKSVIVEDGLAARTMAAYIDLNPVRAQMVENPEDYRWSSYGEAIGGGPRGNGKRAREGLVRALRCHEEAGATAAAAGGASVAAGSGMAGGAGTATKAGPKAETEAAQWSGGVAGEYRRLLLAGMGNARRRTC
jgi:putative transposase